MEKGQKQNEKKKQQIKQIDDVYDERVYIEGHQLYTLKAGNVLNHVSLMELDEENSYYVHVKKDEDCPDLDQIYTGEELLQGPGV